MACTKDMSHVAVGLADGRIILFSGDLIRERGAQKKVFQTDLSLITNLYFSEFQGRLYLFATGYGSIMSYRVTSDSLVEPIVLNGGKGADPSCATVNDLGELVVGDDKSLLTYQPRSKSGQGTPLQPVNENSGTSAVVALGVRGQKPDMTRRFVTWFRRYCVSVEQDKKDIKAQQILTIYDPRINVIAYSGSFDSIIDIVCEWSSIMLITRECAVIQLTEIDTKTKMDTLCKKNNWPIALELAISSGLERSVVSDIHQKYGDHLYGKRDFDGAIQQYIQTIGVLEPSYVIKRFLDAQRTTNLTNYLHKLHEASLANSNHTTLLLNCYTKMSNREELDAFLEKPDLEFDVETAIKVCRQAGYFHEALDLAKRKQRHDWYLKILLEDQKEHKDALVYLMTLPVRDAVQNLHKYGQDFITALPEDTIALLTKTLWEPYQQQIAKDEAAAAANASGFRHDKMRPVIQAEDFITEFVGRPASLVQFLEYIVSKGDPSPRVCNTLLEMYLRNDIDEPLLPGQTVESRKKTREDAAMALLENPNLKFDVGHALVLCQVHKFDRGTLECYEKMKLFNEILQYYMDAGEHDMVLRTCNRLAKDPQMWAKALTYLASRPDASQLLQQVLSTVLNKNKSLPPIQVIRILAQSDHTTLGVVRDHIDRNLKEEQRQIDEDAKIIRETREDTLKKKAEIHALRTEAKVFRENICHACQQPLELPTVHFFCEHAFHLGCLMDENECSVCAPEVRNFMSRQQALQGKARQHDEFFKMLDGSTDRFGVVAQYFGRSIFDQSAPSSGPSLNSQPQSIPTLSQMGLTPSSSSAMAYEYPNSLRSDLPPPRR